MALVCGLKTLCGASSSSRTSSTAAKVDRGLDQKDMFETKDYRLRKEAEYKTLNKSLLTNYDSVYMISESEFWFLLFLVLYIVETFDY